MSILLGQRGQPGEPPAGYVQMRGISRVNPLQLPVKLARDEEAVKGQLQLQDVLLEGVRVRDLQDALPTANEEPG